MYIDDNIVILQYFQNKIIIFEIFRKIFGCLYYDLYAYYITINLYQLLILAYLLSVLLKTMILSIEIGTFRHISKTVKPKNDFSFFFESSCDFEHINIDPESIWIQNAVCRRVRSFGLVICFEYLEGTYAKKKSTFTY